MGQGEQEEQGEQNEEQKKQKKKQCEEPPGNYLVSFPDWKPVIHLLAVDKVLASQFYLSREQVPAGTGSGRRHGAGGRRHEAEGRRKEAHHANGLGVSMILVPDIEEQCVRFVADLLMTQ